jgi:hypothetical protein
MAIGKQYKLVQVSKITENTCEDCWFHLLEFDTCPRINAGTGDPDDDILCCLENPSAPTIWVLQPVTKTEFTDSRYPFPGNVNKLLMDLVNDVNTRPEIRNKIRGLWQDREDTYSAERAWKITKKLHELCWIYC